MNAEKNTKLVLEVFSAIERHDAQRFNELLCTDFEVHWPPSLPYGGASTGRGDSAPTWEETWIPLQPTTAERRMDPRVVAVGEDSVVVHWWQRGVSPDGKRFDGEVLGHYQVRGGKLARAQMFHYDTVALLIFLKKCEAHLMVAKP